MLVTPWGIVIEVFFTLFIYKYLRIGLALADSNIIEHKLSILAKDALSKLLHSEKAFLPILMILSGMLIEVKFVHPQNTDSPIVVTLLGILIDFKFEHPLNANMPIFVTPLGIFIEDKLLLK